MSKLHGIIHTDLIIQEKVNFFADYFQFIVYNIGKLEHLPLENPLSLVDKIIFQIEYNIDYCVPYLNSYFKNEYWTNNLLLEHFPIYNSIVSDINLFKSKNKDIERKNFIDNTPSFTENLKSLRDALNEKMFKIALSEIISYLECQHKIDEHEEAIKMLTHIIVSEFFLTGKSHTDLKGIFSRILTTEITKFPFPKNISTTTHKKKFIQNLTLNEQFSGIYNLLINDREDRIYYFRILNISPPDNFKFKYNKVTFLSSNHPHLNKIKKLGGYLTELFFTPEKFTIASIKTSTISDEIGKNIAFKLIAEECRYLQINIPHKIIVDSNIYIYTHDKKHYSGSNNLNNSYKFTQLDIRLLADNPFVFLKKLDGDSTNHILRCESLFIRAVESKEVTDFWQYLEVLVPKKNGKKQIKEAISNILLINTKKYNKDRLKNFFHTVIHPITTPSKILGITFEEQKKLSNQNVGLDLLMSKTKNKSIQIILTNWEVKMKINNPLFIQQYYYSILNDAYALRNTDVHSGIKNNKSEIQLKATLPQLVYRLRWILFEEIERNPNRTFEELIIDLNDHGLNILKGMNT